MRNVATCCLALVIEVPHLFGCSARPLELLRVSPEIVLVVTHRDKPIEGIEIRIFREKAPIPVFTATTNASGIVAPKHLAAGKYYIYVSHDGFDAPTRWVEVVGNTEAKAVKRVEIEWADWSHETSRVAGTLTGLMPGNTGNTGVAIELKHAFSGEGYKSLSDSSGAFLFPEVPDGTYILTITGGMPSLSGVADITRLVVDVRQKSATSSLPLELRDNGCGGTEF